MDPPSIHIHRSNRLERSVDALCSLLEQPLSDPMSKEWILVQGRGMALWLNMRLSERFGVWANVDYIYPRQLVQRVLCAALGQEPTELALEGYRREQLTWVTLKKLRGLLGQPGFEDLARYLARDAQGVRAFELAEQIAKTFDEYLTYRPEWLRNWEGRSQDRESRDQLDLFANAPVSKAERWQRVLWRALSEELGPLHVANLELDFHKALKRKKRIDTLPERVSVFGLTNLPPLYVRILGSLARQAEVRLFLLSPSQQYFADVRRRAQSGPTLFGPSGSPILEACGALGAEFATIVDAAPSAVGVLNEEHEDYVRADSTLLGRLQNSILDHSTPSSEERVALDSSDTSIALHACHGPIREVEVLHDQVLALLDEGLAPNDILVMMPDVDEYAPLIEAVFERDSDDARRVPFRISDRRAQGDNTVLEAFFRVLMLAERRASASEVLDLLALEPVHTCFGISAADLPTLTRWVVDTGIRWGIDEGHKARSGVPDQEQNSWRFGLDRLLLGYAVNTEGRQTIAGILPYDEVEGSIGELLGRFVHFTHKLFGFCKRLAVEQTAAEWQTTLSELLTSLMAPSAEEAWQRQQVLDASSSLTESAAKTNFEEKLSLRVVRRWLEGHVDDSRQARGFLAGGVTFCAMVPMRSIPFRVVYLLGMNDGTFPRSSHRPDFNLLDDSSRPRAPGDPDRRTDDRYLFLEALLSARERLLISYVGQSVRDNTELAPSIVVAELLDALAQHVQPDADESPSATVARRLITRHPLQPFSPRYFKASEAHLFSYEHSYLGGARLMEGERHEPPSLFPTDLPELPDVDDVTLPELTDFFRSPSAYLFQRRLGVNIKGEHLSVPEREPVELGGLETYAIGAPLLEQRLDGLEREEALTLCRATGWLPAGTPGRLEFERALRSADPIASAVRQTTDRAPLTPLAFELVVGSTKLRGELDNLHPIGRISYRFSRISAEQELRGWLAHLVLCAVAPRNVQAESWLLLRAKTGDGVAAARFVAVEDPLGPLKDLLSLYQRGASRPLPLFADASATFVREQARGKSPRDALEAADKVFRAKYKDDPAVSRLYAAETLHDLDTDFGDVAQLVFGPLLRHLQEGA